MSLTDSSTQHQGSNFITQLTKTFVSKAQLLAVHQACFQGNMYTVLCYSECSSTILDLGPNTGSEWTVPLKKKERKRGVSCQEDQCCHSSICCTKRRNAWIPEPQAKILFGLRECSVFNRCLCQSVWTSLLSQIKNRKGSTRNGRSILLENTATREEDVGLGIVVQIK